MTKYTGITIGPILPTLLRARTTRELWAASFLFSYIMEQLTLELEKKAEIEVISPKVVPLPAGEKVGAGLYPDRILFKQLSSIEPQLIREVAQGVIKTLARKISTHLKFHLPENYPSESDIQTYLESYIQLYGQDIDLQEGHNLIFSFKPYLETIDRRPQLPVLDNNANHLFTFLDRVNAWIPGKKDGSWKPGTSFLIEAGFGKVKRFDSLIEIAARDLQLMDKVKFDKIIKEHFAAVNGNELREEEQLLKEFSQEFGAAFKHYHKHLAIVHADGDSVGALLRIIGTDAGLLKEFSAVLSKFAQSAANQVHNFGGLPIYAGGDELLFLAPVRICYRKAQKEEEVIDTNESVFDLIHAIDHSFQQATRAFIENKKLSWPDDAPKPTLSFGMAISHFKSPLYERLEDSRNALFEGAKKQPGKHRLTIHFTTHSDQSFKYDLPLGHQQGWQQFRKTINLYNRENQIFPSSFARRLYELQPLLEVMIGKRFYTVGPLLEEL
ncbi:MAG: hypothetical protein KDC44_18370, partial [Phaeodactylibacter sp.]|nr:hypothetical protein [Phaeodactylibacter sp.]